MKRSAFVVAFKSGRYKNVQEDTGVLIGLKARNRKWEFFGGTLNKGEKPEDGACREFFEETLIPIIPKRLIPLDPFKCKNGDMVYPFVTIIHEAWKVRLSKEHVKWEWRSLKQLRKKDMTKKSNSILNAIIIKLKSRKK